MKYFIIGCVLFLVSCQEHDDSFKIENESNDFYKIEIIDKNDYSKNSAVTKALKSFETKKQKYLQGISSTNGLEGILNKGTYLSDYNVTVEENNVSHIQAGDYESYTYQIYNDAVSDELHNLLLSKKTDGTYEAYIIKYKLTQGQQYDIVNGIFPSDLGDESTTTTFIDLQANYQTASMSGGFDPCDDYPCAITHDGVDYIVSAPNTCHTFNSELVNGTWVTSYPIVSCPPEFDDGSSQGGGGTTGGGSNDGGNDSSGSGNTQGGGATGGTNNPDPEPDDGNSNGEPGGGPNTGGNASGGTTNPGGDDDNDYFVCPPPPEDYDGDLQCASDVTTPTICLAACQAEIVQEECDEVTDFLEQNPNFKTVLKSLDDQSNIDFEKSCTQFENVTAIIYEEGNANEPEVRIPTGLTNKMQAFAHYHYETTTTVGGDTESVFSLDDLIEIARLASFGQLDDNFVTFLSTGKGTYYAFTIADVNRFVGNMNALLNPSIPNTTDPNVMIAWNDNRIKWENLTKKYYESTNSVINSSNLDNTEVLGAFLELLNEADLGLNMFKADQDFNTFSKVTFDPNSPNNIKEDNCN